MPEGTLDIGESALQFGRDLFRLGFTVTQLVQGYGAVSEAATALAHERGAQIGPEEHEVLNAALDIAIAHAVDGYQREHDQVMIRRETGNLAFHAHQLRSALAAASVSFRALKKSGARCDGRIGGRLERSLGRMRGLIDSALAEERLRAQTEPRMEDIPLMELVDQIIATALLGADARRVTLTATIDPDLNLRGDRQLLLSALANLMADAVIASMSGGHVRMRGSARGNMVVVEIENACSSLAQGQVDGSNAEGHATGPGRSQTRPGLPIARQAVSLHGGTVSVRETPGKNRVVTVELPRGSPRCSA